MDWMPRPTNTPSQDTIARAQECQDLLIENEELSKQKEEHIKHLAVCEGTVAERRRTVQACNDRGSDTAAKAIRPIQADLDEHKHLVMAYLNTIKKLQSAYRELILGVLTNADPDRLHRRREMLSTAFHLARDVHLRIRQKGGDLVRPCKRKRRPVKGSRAGRRSRNG